MNTFFRWSGLVLAFVLAAISVEKGWLNPALKAAPVMATALFVAGLGLLLFRPTGRPIRSAFTRIAFASRRRSFNLGLFGVGVLLYSIASHVIFRALPHIDDSVAALFQAKIFASGQLVVPYPEAPEFFFMTCLIDSRHGLGHICSIYPPGHPALLTLGLWIGAPWLINPLLGGGLAVVTHELGRQLSGKRVGRIAGLLCLASPFVVMLSASHLSHLTAAFALTTCAWAVVRMIRTTRWAYGALAGAMFLLAFLSRPFTALVVGAIIGLIPLWNWRRLWRCRVGIVAAGLFAILAAVLLGLYQAKTTGDWRTAGHEVGLDANRLGFGQVGDHTTHSPRQAWKITRTRMTAINHQALGWPIPFYVIALLPFFLRSAKPQDLWLLLPSTGLLAAFFFFYYFEFHLPARYIFSGLPMLLILAAKGLHLSGRRTWVSALIAGCIGIQLFVYIPFWKQTFRPSHGDVEPLLDRVVKDYGITNAVVFIASTESVSSSVNNDVRNNYFASGMMHNPVTFDGEVVYAQYIKGGMHRLAKHYPNRAVYQYTFNLRLEKAHLHRIELDGRKAIWTEVPPKTDDLIPYVQPDRKSGS